MITFPKVKAVSWAIGKRLQGYHLLQNPKGSPQTEVNMIKQNFYGVSSHWDDIFHVTRLKKTFLPDETYSEKKFLMSTHYFNLRNKQMTSPRKKDINFSIKKDGEYIVYKDREDLGLTKAEKRNVPKISYKRSSFMLYDSEYDKLCYSKRSAEENRGYYKKSYRLIDKILCLGMHEKMVYPTENRPNFFKVLYKNLTNKG